MITKRRSPEIVSCAPTYTSYGCNTMMIEGTEIIQGRQQKLPQQKKLQSVKLIWIRRLVISTMEVKDLHTALLVGE